MHRKRATKHVKALERALKESGEMLITNKIVISYRQSRIRPFQERPVIDPQILIPITCRKQLSGLKNLKPKGHKLRSPSAFKPSTSHFAYVFEHIKNHNSFRPVKYRGATKRIHLPVTLALLL